MSLALFNMIRSLSSKLASTSLVTGNNITGYVNKRAKQRSNFTTMAKSMEEPRMDMNGVKSKITGQVNKKAKQRSYFTTMAKSTEEPRVDMDGVKSKNNRMSEQEGKTEEQLHHNGEVHGRT